MNYMRKIYFLLLCTVASYSQTQIGSDIDGEAAGDISGYSVSLSSDPSKSLGMRIYIKKSETWNILQLDKNNTDRVTHISSSGSTIFEMSMTPSSSPLLRLRLPLPYVSSILVTLVISSIGLVPCFCTVFLSFMFCNIVKP